VLDQRRAFLLVALMGLPALLLLVSALFAGMPAAHGHIERGVRVAGVDAGGHSWAASAPAIQSRVEDFLAQPLTLRAGDRSLRVTPLELGATYDANATRQRAEHVGRGMFFTAAADRFNAHLRGVDVAPVVTFDDNTLMAVLRQLSVGVVTPPTDAEFAWDGNELAIKPSADGVGLNTAAGVATLRARMAQLDARDVTVPTVALPPNVTTQNLQAARDHALALAGQPLQLTADGIATWQMGPAELASLLVYSDGKVTLDERALAGRIGTLSGTLDQQPRDAALQTNDDGTFSIAPAASARKLDVQASAQAALSALAAGQHDVTLALTVEQPAVQAADLQPLQAKASDIVKRGMVVSWSDGDQALDPAAFAATIRFDETNGAVTFDHQALFTLLEPIAEAINRPASGLRWRDGVIVDGSDAVSGRSVDIAASVNALASAALGGQGNVPLVVNESDDPAQSASSIDIQELLGSASTYYGYSTANRRTNVELAAASLDGALIQPGGTFSFDNAIGGTATLDDGYTVGFGIVAGADGTPKTVPSVAGGICQVATTTFQAAFWAGMPIGERNWHLYWIPNYGSGPGGLTGLDATVDPDSGLDFTFYNPTNSWLAIRAVADGEWLTVEVWGTNQGWQVNVDQPIITNVVKADQTPVRQINDQLQPGEEVLAEHAEDGFTATIHRSVVKDGQVVDDVTLVSVYQPSQNVTLIGPGGDTTVTPVDNGDDDSDDDGAESTPVDTPADIPAETPTDVPADVEETPAAEDTSVSDDPTPTAEDVTTSDETPPADDGDDTATPEE
jgi:vancomycin resistance protein YoaR